MTVLILLLILVWTLGLVRVVLGALLRAPDREIGVRVRALPRPRVEIVVRSSGGLVRTDQPHAHDPHNPCCRQVSTG